MPLIKFKGVSCKAHESREKSWYYSSRFLPCYAELVLQRHWLGKWMGVDVLGFIVKLGWRESPLMEESWGEVARKLQLSRYHLILKAPRGPSLDQVGPARLPGWFISGLTSHICNWVIFMLTTTSRHNERSWLFYIKPIMHLHRAHKGAVIMNCAGSLHCAHYLLPSLDPPYDAFESQRMSRLGRKGAVSTDSWQTSKFLGSIPLLKHPVINLFECKTALELNENIRSRRVSCHFLSSFLFS